MALATPRITDVCNAVVGEIQALKNDSGLEYTARRVYSFGFSDGDLLNPQVVVRDWDIDHETESRGTEERIYEVQVGVYKMVSRRDVSEIDKYFRLSIAIGGLYPIDREITIGAGKVGVARKRPFPLVFRNATVMDVPDGSTRFISHWLIGFREVVEE